jgi:hypothetical protein
VASTPPVLDASSSGWAWTAIIVSFSDMLSRLPDKLALVPTGVGGSR